MAITTQDVFVGFLKAIKFNQTNMGMNKSMGGFELAVDTITLFVDGTHDQNEVRQKLNELVQMGLLVKEQQEERMRNYFHYRKGAPEFTNRTFTRNYYKLTDKGIAYVNSLRAR